MNEIPLEDDVSIRRNVASSDYDDLRAIEDALSNSVDSVQRVLDLIAALRRRLARDPVVEKAIEDGIEVLEEVRRSEPEQLAKLRESFPGSLEINNPSVGYGESRKRKRVAEKPDDARQRGRK